MFYLILLEGLLKTNPHKSQFNFFKGPPKSQPPTPKTGNTFDLRWHIMTKYLSNQGTNTGTNSTTNWTPRHPLPPFSTWVATEQKKERISSFIFFTRMLHSIESFCSIQKTEHHSQRRTVQRGFVENPSKKSFLVCWKKKLSPFFPRFGFPEGGAVCIKHTPAEDNGSEGLDFPTSCIMPLVL